MRTCLLFASLLFAPNSFTQETPTDAPNEAAAKAAPADSHEAQPAAAEQLAEPPLYRHPTLFGMLRRNNAIRRRVGLFPHRISPALTQAAQDHANYMAQTGQFSHYTNGGPQYRANKYGFRGGVLENIAYGTTTIDGAFNMWQSSGAHYASIVSGTTEAGFGYAISASGQFYWVGVYASPAQGDEAGEAEDEVAKAVAEDLKRKEAEKNVAQEQPVDPNVVPASTPVPAENVAGENPAGNANPTNAAPGNTNYYYNYSHGRRGRRRS